MTASPSRRTAALGLALALAASAPSRADAALTRELVPGLIVFSTTPQGESYPLAVPVEKRAASDPSRSHVQVRGSANGRRGDVRLLPGSAVIATVTRIEYDQEQRPIDRESYRFDGAVTADGRWAADSAAAEVRDPATGRPVKGFGGFPPGNYRLTVVLNDVTTPAHSRPVMTRLIHSGFPIFAR